jgi:NAD(P)H-dependent flavin oxidoreductase YrpB (nitropropane dioxygenase family)
MPAEIQTELTKQLKINHPIFLAGMNVAAGPKLAAAVTNAGGIGVIGGVGLVELDRTVYTWKLMAN